MVSPSEVPAGCPSVAVAATTFGRGVVPVLRSRQIVQRHNGDVNSGMSHANDINMTTKGLIPSLSVADCLNGAAGGWLALHLKFDGRNVDVLHEIVETLDWRGVTFGYSIEATIQCRDIGALVMLRLADPGTRGLRWHPADFIASCQPCLDPFGLVAFVEHFTPDAAIDLVGDARIEFADADVLRQFLVACDARRYRFQTRDGRQRLIVRGASCLPGPVTARLL